MPGNAHYSSGYKLGATHINKRKFEGAAQKNKASHPASAHPSVANPSAIQPLKSFTAHEVLLPATSQQQASSRAQFSSTRKPAASKHTKSNTGILSGLLNVVNRGKYQSDQHHIQRSISPFANDEQINEATARLQEKKNKAELSRSTVTPTRTTDATKTNQTTTQLLGQVGQANASYAPPIHQQMVTTRVPHLTGHPDRQQMVTPRVPRRMPVSTRTKSTQTDQISSTIVPVTKRRIKYDDATEPDSMPKSLYAEYGGGKSIPGQYYQWGRQNHRKTFENLPSARNLKEKYENKEMNIIFCPGDFKGVHIGHAESVSVADFPVTEHDTHIHGILHCMGGDASPLKNYTMRRNSEVFCKTLSMLHKIPIDNAEALHHGTSVVGDIVPFTFRNDIRERDVNDPERKIFDALLKDTLSQRIDHVNEMIELCYNVKVIFAVGKHAQDFFRVNRLSIKIPDSAILVEIPHASATRMHFTEKISSDYLHGFNRAQAKLLGKDVVSTLLPRHFEMLGPRRAVLSEEDAKKHNDNIKAGVKGHFDNRSEEDAKKRNDNIKAGVIRTSRDWSTEVYRAWQTASQLLEALGTIQHDETVTEHLDKMRKALDRMFAKGTFGRPISIDYTPTGLVSEGTTCITTTYKDAEGNEKHITPRIRINVAKEQDKEYIEALVKATQDHISSDAESRQRFKYGNITTTNSLGTSWRYSLIYLIIERALVGNTMAPLPTQLGWWKCPDCNHSMLGELPAQGWVCPPTKGGCGVRPPKSKWIEYNGQPNEL